MNRRNPHELRELVRLARGELAGATAEGLRARLRREPELRVAYERLLGAWEGLEEPPARAVDRGVDPSFRAEVMERVRRAAAGEPGLGWRGAPAWAKAAAAVAAVCGVVLGSGLAAAGGDAGGAEEWLEELTLAESWVEVLARDAGAAGESLPYLPEDPEPAGPPDPAEPPQ
jgi:hypothetical protein